MAARCRAAGDHRGNAKSAGELRDDEPVTEKGRVSKLRVLDLFSGIGGFSLGLERTDGFETIAFCEIDPFCRKVLAKHWPDVPCHDDITTREFQEGEADVITGGFPCQDLSRAGKRAGLSGSRSGLFWQLERAIRVVRPEFAIMENVADLLDDGMGVVCGALAESRYDAEWDCFPAYTVGSPQQRERVYIVAHANERQRRDRCSPSIRRRLAGAGEGASARSRSDCDGSRELQPSWCFRYLGGRPVHRGTGSDVWRTNWTDALGALCRMADGVSRRLVETRPLGNAVVPQIPELIGRAILASAWTEKA